jgi:hypothetical protein
MPTDDQTPGQHGPVPAEPASAMALTLSQRFELTRMGQVIDTCHSVDELRVIAKQLLEAWQTQKAATNWVIGQQTGWRADGLRSHPVDR